MVSLSIDPPRGGARRNGNGGGGGFKLKLLFLLVVFGAGGAAGFWAGRYTAREGVLGVGRVTPAEESAAAPAQAADPAATAGTDPQPSVPDPRATPVPPAPAAAGVDSAAAPTATAATPPAPVPPASTGPRRASVVLKGALEESLTAALAPEDRDQGQQLTQVVNRLLVWHLNVSREGRKGDRLEVLWEPAPKPTGELMLGMAPSQEPIVHAIRYASQKLGKEIAAYRFQAPGAKWPRYYQADGTELEERLVDGPIGEYEQITSLLRDGRKHEGVDFKTPTGTPVTAPFDGRIVKRNWNFRFNGNCLDLVDAKTGRHAIFLHLDVIPKELAVGRTVKKGEVIAASGNSGRSYAPHLHYQLEDAGGRVLDPFAIHATTRASLDPAHRPAFDAQKGKLDPLLVSAAR